MFDRMNLQVLANHARAAAENMGYTLQRTAHSAFVKETEDFTVMLLNRRGETFAVPMDLGATWYVGLTFGRAIEQIKDYKPGDVAFTNDTYAAHVATHTPDTVLWKPVFYDGEIIAWTGGHIHNTDMGGAVPASLSRALTDIHQEGIRFPPMKIVNEGVYDEQIMRIMTANVRKPDLNVGDIKALVGALNTGERKILAMVEKFGKEAFLEGVEQLMDHSEAQARDILRSMPDGTWEFIDYADEDSVEANPCRLKLTLTIKGDEAILDFTGSDPQLGSSLNVPSGGDPRHSILLVAIYYILYTLNPKILLNTGLTRPFTCIAPRGSVLNPISPAAVGMRSLTCARLRSLVFGGFAQAVPDRLPAAPAGNNCIVNVMTTDERSGQRMITAVNPVCGGGGGMPHRDGTNGSGADAAYLKNPPIEITETETPVEFVRYGLAQDTGGPGRWRGGLATRMAFRVFSPDSRITARNRDRSRFRPWGMLGGRAAGLSDMWLNPGTPDAKRLGNIDTAVLQPGDVLEIVSAGGGGRGNPLEREPWRVAQDVERGYVSIEAAAREYGVVISGGAVDEVATVRLRSNFPAPTVPFHYGPEREAYESQWSRPTYDLLTEILSGLPIHWRFFAKTEIFRRMEGRSGPEGVAQALAEVRARFPEMPDPVPPVQEAAE